MDGSWDVDSAAWFGDEEEREDETPEVDAGELEVAISCIASLPEILRGNGCPQG